MQTNIFSNLSIRRVAFVSLLIFIGIGVEQYGISTAQEKDERFSFPPLPVWECRAEAPAFRA